MKRAVFTTLILAGALVSPVLSACQDPQEAPSVTLPVMVDRSAIVASKNDRGYTVKLSQARVVVQNLAFAVGGEAHEDAAAASKPQALLSWVIPRAYAHPGHFEGGEVTGELSGRFVLDWFSGRRQPQKVGNALLLYGKYTSANLVLGRGGEKDGLRASDPLFGHTALLAGVATKGDLEVKFIAVIDAPLGREILGVPFELEVNAATDAPLGFRLHTLGAINEASMFDGVDFAKLERDEAGIAYIQAQTKDKATRSAYLRIRRTFQTQEQFAFRATTMKRLAKMAAAPVP